MTLAIFYKLLALIATAGLGWVAGRMRWLGGPDDGDPAKVLSNVAFYIFVPALLFRTMVRLDVSHMPWGTVVAFFVPVVLLMLAVYVQQRLSSRAPVHGPAQKPTQVQPQQQPQQQTKEQAQEHAHGAAAPSVRAICTVFGNSLQVGVPFAAALFGESGLAIHIALVSLHALVLLSVLTVLVELDLARESARHTAAQPLWRTLLQTARNTLIHPVVLPVLAGLGWNMSGLPMHPVMDEALATAAQGVVPTCLVLIGLTLASYGLKGSLRGALWISAGKLLLLPALVLLVAHWGFGLGGTPLAVVVMMAAMPVGANAMIFAQRYRTLQAEATAASVLSTVAFAATAPLWLVVLGRLQAHG